MELVLIPHHQILASLPAEYDIIVTVINGRAYDGSITLHEVQAMILTQESRSEQLYIGGSVNVGSQMFVNYSETRVRKGGNKERGFHNSQRSGCNRRGIGLPSSRSSGIGLKLVCQICNKLMYSVTTY
ncbi:conserved hypothetical protein [Ricinus communis]|uniref:Uncharacterized protein n=1 Tax=Ricinus communis TaxID=3988 RepID=B9SR62_RICCO|nr:conserved hypothetical protein [Ricinus communis]